MEDRGAANLDAADQFRAVMSRSPTPVTIVTATGESGPQGIVIGSFVSVSLEPPLIGFFVGRPTRMWQPMAAADAYCVSILAEDQAALSILFATPGIDRFEIADWEPAGNGAPRLAGAVAWIEAGPHSVTEAGDHDLILLQVTALRLGRATGPLVYHRGAYTGVYPPPEPSDHDSADRS
jgi:flavin reductase (DIM6/NTAB) family NADH-FMN oxidoreductase RutF